MAPEGRPVEAVQFAPSLVVYAAFPVLGATTNRLPSAATATEPIWPEVVYPGKAAVHGVQVTPLLFE